MKAKKEISFASAILVLSILACNLPGAGSGGTEPVATPLSPVAPVETVLVIVENTATIAPVDTPTSTPSISPEITLTQNSNCRLGPSTYYNIVDQIANQAVLPVVGRNDDNTWWQVVNATKRECWIFNENASPNTDFSGLQVGNAPPLPGIPQNFFVTNQVCQPGPKKFTVSLSWSSGGGETAFRLYRDGNRIAELKATKYSYRDPSAPYNKNITYEIESVNENGTSEKAIQIVPFCK